MPLSTFPWTNDYRLHSVRFHPEGGSEVIIGGITSGGIVANADILKEITSGAIYPQTAVLQVVRPVASFTTFALDQVWGAGGPGVVGGTASCIHSGLNPGLQMYFAKQDCAGPGAADHLEYTIGEGVIVPTTLSVDHRGNAQMSYDIYASSPDGVASPIIKTEVATLPTIAGNGLRWTMDQMTIGNIAAWGKRNINVAFNPSVSQEGADSTKFDSVVLLASLQPRVTIQGVDPNWLDDEAANDGITDLDGETVSASNTILYLKERNSLLTATNWITLAAHGLLNWETVITGDPNSPAQTTLNIDVIQVGAQTLIALTGQNQPT